MDTVTEVKSDIDPREEAAFAYLLERVDRLRGKIGGYVTVEIGAGRHSNGELSGRAAKIYASRRGEVYSGSSIDETEARLFEKSDLTRAKELRGEAERLLSQAANLEAGQ